MPEPDGSTRGGGAAGSCSPRVGTAGDRARGPGSAEPETGFGRTIETVCAGSNLCRQIRRLSGERTDTR
ncbi:MAG TPA: hypothetical protein K8V84_18245 [Nocardiopsis listeri]|uniref:hypothetical protein n=1 Tax=Nocardiopsis listeri TaxID=53440 RepID=UPI001D6CC907|nr:hypothetical protein [Nocardiopsis listeri]HJE60428.1 hypothetical protein [Nocardiopsis listeri]